MSKFFKALEQAERDRVGREGRSGGSPESPAPPETPSVAPAGPERAERAPTAAATPAAPLVVGPRPHPVVGPTPRPEPDRAATLPASDPPAPRAVPSPPADLGAEAHTAVEEHLVSLLFPAAFEAEQYRHLRHVIEHQRAATGLTVIAVTSPAIGDGKTTTAINLAGALAQAQGVRVLLVDADLRRPSVAEHLGLRRLPDRRELPGLVDALVDETFELDAVTQSYAEFNLDVVTAGGVPETPYEVLRSPRFAELLAEARRHYDYVVLDTPPLVAVPDSRLITKAVDGVLLVIGAHRTPRRLLEEALGLVEPANLLGLVYNQDDRPLSGYYRGYYGAHSLATNGHGTSRWERLVRRGRRGGPRG